MQRVIAPRAAHPAKPVRVSVAYRVATCGTAGGRAPSRRSEAGAGPGANGPSETIALRYLSGAGGERAFDARVLQKRRGDPAPGQRGECGHARCAWRNPWDTPMLGAQGVGFVLRDPQPAGLSAREEVLHKVRVCKQQRRATRVRCHRLRCAQRRKALLLEGHGAQPSGALGNTVHQQLEPRRRSCESVTAGRICCAVRRGVGLSAASDESAGSGPE